MGAPWFGMGCEAQTAAIAGAIARICNAADRPKQGCARREELVQRRLNLCPVATICNAVVEMLACGASAKNGEHLYEPNTILKALL
jgi:hypothetical protein